MGLKISQEVSKWQRINLNEEEDFDTYIPNGDGDFVEEEE